MSSKPPPSKPLKPSHGLELATPSLTLDFTISVKLHPKISVGPTPWGQRNWISFVGGEWEATWGSGTVIPGGQDSQLVTPSLATKLETNYLLKTNDSEPAYIVIKTSGWRTGPREVLEKLFDPEQANSVKPSEYSFRLYVNMETGDERYSFLNEGLWVGSGARLGAEVIYDAYRVG